MATYDWDDIAIDPQPTEHEWDYPIILGDDGDGAPILAKYSRIVLRVPLVLGCHFWEEYQSQTGTLTAPAPNTVDDFTDYTSVYVRSVKHGVVLKKDGMRGVEMEIVKVAV
jgi:hypothetical protein